MLLNVCVAYLQTLLLFSTLVCCSAKTYAAEPSKVALSFQGERAVAISQQLFAQGEFGKALDNAELAIRSDPKSGIAQVHKAMILDRIKKTQKAHQSYAKALKLSPTDGYVLNAVAISFCARGQVKESDALFVRAVQDTDYPIPQQALQNAGFCAFKAGNFVLAEQRFRSALIADPQTVQSLELMSQIKFKQSNFFEARAFMQRREALGPLSVPLLQLAQQIEKSAGDDRAAAQYQKQLVILLQSQIQPPTGEGQKKP